MLHWAPADNNELGTRHRINEHLRVDPARVHPITHQRGTPRMFFVREGPEYPNGCSHVIRETQAQRRVKIGVDQRLANGLVFAEPPVRMWGRSGRRCSGSEL